LSTLINEFLPVGLNRDRMRQLMGARHLDGMLLTSPENVFYVTGYTTLPTAGNSILYLLRNRLPFFAFMGADGHTTLFCWMYSTMGVELGVDDVVGFSDYTGAVDQLANFMKQHVNHRIGIESSCPYYVVQLLSQTPIEVADDVMIRARTIKTAREIDYLARSLAASEATLGDVYEILRPGMGRLEVIANAKARLFKHRATGIGHSTITFGTANPELAIDEKLEDDHLVTLDIGAVYEGYASDTRRYAYSGTPPAQLVDHYARMVDVVDQVGAAIKPGATYADVFRRGRDLLTEVMGSPPGWLSHVGHHIGLETEEEWITDRDDIEIQPSMVINIELYSQAPTSDYIGDEETFVVNAGGSTRTSLLPRELRAI
jgi:Xaa-Pro aminopeptidase